MAFKSKEQQLEAARKGGQAILKKRGFDYMKKIAEAGALDSSVSRKRKKLYEIKTD
jgi:hypothetical protein